ncbi:pyridoxamine 5'-phosphate oxidase family protein [Aurantiacibacter zhengii]|uniref:Pyridoxamine 5'-phosphate oxidase family protein n=1 Tax=Aurantiacibacter zhengii TaxID=2307003 RepID=A0A418NT45_9SPHN|nr:pyridoxamine 5'-phosphate oxidase family protein [Aurantiacibacter zhengii]RIV86657.1 pyridoxamine 5'-phosphate oxidase family protein [Aurantiacibacter zhengii]
MADFFEALNEKHIAMIEAQPVFFVATSAPGARINLSPKGYDAFRVLSPTRVGYLDLAGSGNETNAHLLADGRITLMFCNFQQPALILQIYGAGKPVLPSDSGWDAIARHFTLLPGTRQIFDIEIESVQTSCGWGVPFMEFERERQTLLKAHTGVDPQKWATKHSNRRESIDGLPTRPTDRYIAGNLPQEG